MAFRLLSAFVRVTKNQDKRSVQMERSGRNKCFQLLFLGAARRVIKSNQPVSRKGFVDDLLFDDHLTELEN